MFLDLGSGSLYMPKLEYHLPIMLRLFYGSSTSLQLLKPKQSDKINRNIVTKTHSLPSQTREECVSHIYALRNIGSPPFLGQDP